MTAVAVPPATRPVTVSIATNTRNRSLILAATGWRTRESPPLRPEDPEDEVDNRPRSDVHDPDHERHSNGECDDDKRRILKLFVVRPGDPLKLGPRFLDKDPGVGDLLKHG